MFLRVEAIVLALSLAKLGLACSRKLPKIPAGETHLDCFWDGTAPFCNGDCTGLVAYSTFY